MPASSPSATARIIHLAMLSGVVVLALGLSLVPVPQVEDGVPLFLYATFGVGAVMFAGAMVIASRLPRDGAARDPEGWWRQNLPRAVVVWAMLDGPSILGALVRFLTGSYLPLVVTGVGVVLFLLLAPSRLIAE